MRRLIATVALVVGSTAAVAQAPSNDVAGWLADWEHHHASRRGTPYVHAFGMEPAFLGRDLLFSWHRSEAGDETEDEFEAELEWALTRRLGVVVELPFARVSESGGESHAGVGDVQVAPRALFVETDGFLLAASVDVAFPTGDDDRDLGSGELMLGPALTTWSDLAGGFTLQARLGTEHGTESGDSLLGYHAALIWTWGSAREAVEHVAAGMTSLIAELGGRTILDGPGNGRTTAEALFGFSHALSERWEVRAGLQFPVGGPEDIDRSFIVGAILHF